MSSLYLKNLVVTRGDFPAIAQADFEIPPNSFTLVTGENGSGKTTLLKAVSGISEIQRGSIQYGNHSAPRDLRKSIAYVGHSAVFIRHVTVEEHLNITKKIDSNLYKSSAKEKYVLDVAQSTKMFNLSDKLDVRVEDLSAGQQRRLHLATSLIRSTPILCIDEPHASLDETSKKQFDEIISRQFELGRTLMIATHDPQRMENISTHRINIVNGICAKKEVSK